ncbi:hypothetical protein EV281_10615 [Rhizobium sp. BK418]|nr:hypothetical protein EV281_10615 [Rhizobium sp. BK418]
MKTIPPIRWRIHELVDGSIDLLRSCGLRLVKEMMVTGCDYDTAHANLAPFT